MFISLHVKNFKSFIDVNIDFTNKKGTPRKLVAIYGENGSGKSNLVDVFDFVARIIYTKYNNRYHPNFDSHLFDVTNNYNTLEKLIYVSKTIDSKDNMEIEYTIKLNNKYYKYCLHFDNEKVIYEKLSVIKNSKEKDIFVLNNNFINIDKAIINSKYQENILYEIEKYWGKHTFFSIMYFELIDKNYQFIEDNINLDILSYLHYLLELTAVRHKVDGISPYIFIKGKYLLLDVNEGIISKQEETFLKKTEKILNIIATSLYSDITQVYYKQDNDGGHIKYKLSIKKNMGNNIIDIEFTKESAGTNKLFSLVPFLTASLIGDTIIIDELDTGIHDIMIQNLLKSIYPYIKGQIIFTTHNTSIMESDIPKDSIYILDIEPNREKTILSIADYEDKIHPYHNIRKRYLSGLYGGTPVTNDIDFNEILRVLKDETN